MSLVNSVPGLNMSPLAIKGFETIFSLLEVTPMASPYQLTFSYGG